MKKLLGIAILLATTLGWAQFPVKDVDLLKNATTIKK